MARRLKIGWVGNYRRNEKNFDVAIKYCVEFGHDLYVAGPPETVLYRPHSEMPGFYRTKDVYLSTSQKEAHPLGVYEALSCGVPVAMLDVGDCRVEGLPGICYYDRLDSQLIDDCITEIIRNPDIYRGVGRKEILRRWQWKHWIPKYVHMFQSVAHKRNEINLCIIVDKPSWAWDIMANKIKNELSKTRDIQSTTITYVRGYGKNKLPNIHGFDPYLYDAILNHCWETYNHFNYPDFPHTKNIPCVNGELYLSKRHAEQFIEIAENASALTTVSKVIYNDLRKRFNSVYHCSRGVDTEEFSP